MSDQDKIPASMHKTANLSTGLLTARFLTNAKGKVSGRHWLTFTGIAIGVFALLTVSSVMNGFDQDMRRRIIGTRAEIRFENKTPTPLENYPKLLAELTQRKDIESAAPVVRNELMLVHRGAMAATVSYGIDLNAHRKVTQVLLPVPDAVLMNSANEWIQGIVNGHPEGTDLEQNGIILGAELAQSLDANLGDTLQLVSPLGTIPTPLGLLPRTLAVRVAGIFIAGMPEYDKLYSYISLANGQYFSGYADAIDYFDIKTTREKQLFKITKNLQNAFPQYKVQNWSAFDTSLYNAMHFEKYLMLVVLGLMFIIASFNMSGNIYRTIVQKRKTIGVLKTIGYTRRDILKTFAGVGLLIALAGILCGILAALLFFLVQSRLGLIRLPIGDMPSLILPVQLRLGDYLLIPLAALLVTSLSIWLPARKATEVDPISLIREIV